MILDVQQSGLPLRGESLFAEFDQILKVGASSTLFTMQTLFKFHR